MEHVDGRRMAAAHDGSRAGSVGGAKAARPKSALRSRMCLVLAVLDVLALALGFSAAGALPLVPGGAREIVIPFALMAPVYVVAALFNRAYSPVLIHETWTSIGRALRALVMATAGSVMIAFFLAPMVPLSRTTLVAGIALAGALLIVERYLFGRNARAVIGGDPYEVLVIHDDAFEGLPEHGAVSMSLLADEAFDPASLSPAAYDRFAQAIAHADRVVVRCPAERRQHWAQALKGANVLGEVTTPEIARLNPLGTGSHAGEPTLVVSRGPLGVKDRVVKRAFDLAVAGAALMMLAPIMLAVALAIRLQDRGPVFFRQIRVGRANRQFRIMKFRSMSVEGSDEAGNRSASRSDDRITPLGRVIRKTSIDELPQLINVLKGDMSIVGPRPHALGSTAEDQLFWHIDERYWHRHAIKPGLTGLAQVRGYRGATHRKADLVNRLQSDLEYLSHWTIWRDMMIVIRTLGVVFHKNAY